MAIPVESVLVLALAIVLFGVWMLFANEEGVSIGEALRFSAWYFLAPILLLVALAHSIPAIVLLLIPFVILVEEGLKRAAAREAKPNEKAIFYLVSLYGLWELAVAKALMPFLPGWVSPSGYWSLAASAWLTTLPVAMHVATAAIYAFYPGTRRRFRFWICVALHWAFNASRALYGMDGGFDDIHPGLLIADTLFWVSLAATLVVVGRRRNRCQSHPT